MKSRAGGGLGLALAAALALSPAPPLAGAPALDSQEGYALLAALAAEAPRERRKAAKKLVAAGDETLLPGLVDGLFFTPRNRRGEAFEVLSALTGERHERYLDWIEAVGRRADLEPKPGYRRWKSSLFARIDPRYREVLSPERLARIRLEEVVPGGVPLDGIPSLERPHHVPAPEATHLDDAERVFGVALGGEARAYPLRILSWHEMANDVVGGEPVTLSYCTLCGSGVLYSGRVGGAARTFGTSGLLYRSNKLMFDRDTLSLWSNLTGEAVVGPAAEAGQRLEMLPMTLTSWGEWRSRHPATTALSLPAGGERYGFDYRPGAADRARRGVVFPVWRTSDRLERNAEIYALVVAGTPKAYRLAELLSAGVLNDRLGDTALVLVADPESGAVRAYRRAEHRFSRTAAGELVDERGGRWRLGEDALEPVAEPGTVGESLARLPGHTAFWFGWYGFYPHTEVWDGGGAAR